MITLMLQAHAYAFQHGGQFGGVCGYPTFQGESQTAATQRLAKLGWEMELPWNVCPPLEAVLEQDDHYILLEEDELLHALAQSAVQDAKKNDGSSTSSKSSSSSSVWFTPEWMASMESKRKSAAAGSSTGAIQEDILWQQILAGQAPDQRHRRLRGLPS